MSKKGKQQHNITGPAAWQTMSAGVRKSKEYYKKDKAGWGKIFGEVDIVSTDNEESQVETEGVKKNYFARFLSPMSGIVQAVQTQIKPEQRYEVGFDVATSSRAGVLATTVTFFNDAKKPVGLPSSTGVKLSTLEPDSYSPVSFVTRPAPEGAVSAQLTFTVFGAEYQKVVDLDKVALKEIS
ncbi:MAG: hypothetical protein CVV03_07590 [Firmicutes bacterium HGW-Firmicutes-8]|nr:MAG: hypothetical protein CVV03_07590 [Firmicutes bacterium HGW-Firmicutes-8]